jgi:UDP-glucose:(galactosyl)LPS alpha-1,2-glucosyltransferase
MNELKNMVEKSGRHEISFIYIDPKRFEGAPKNNGSWTEIVYYRLLAPELLKDYDKAIYVDVDVLFKGDLTEVYNTDLTDYEIAAVPVEVNSPNTICHKYFPENKNKWIYISSFIVFNLEKMRKENIVQKFFDTIKTIDKRLCFFDLDVLNIALDNIKPLPFTYGTFQSVMCNEDVTKAAEYGFLKGIYSVEDLENARKDVVFVHYAGDMGKPWRRHHIPRDYKQCMDSIPKKLKRFTFRDIRKRFFSKD